MDINYKISQCDNSSSWLFLIHGLFGSADNLAIIKRHFEKQYNIVSIDLPDHGESKWTNGFDVTNAANAINDIVETLSLSSAAILGHSLGGKVAMQFALNYPEKVSHLVVADIAPVAYNHRHYSIFNGLNAVPLDDIQGRKDAETAMSEFIEEPGVRQFLLKSLYKTDEGIWSWRFNLAGLIESYPHIVDWQQTSKQFNGPTLFIKGGNSDYITADHKAAIGIYFPNAKAHIIEGVGHWLHAEKPAAFNSIVERMLQKN